MTALTVDIMEDFINTIVLTSNLISISDDGTNTTLFVDNMYHLRFDMNVNIDSVDYNVLSVDRDNQSFIVEGVILTANIIIIPNPFYFHGTPYATNSHISYLSDSEKVPMIYLKEIFREVKQSQDSSIEKESDIELHFVDVANYEDWDNDDFYAKVIAGLNKLVNKFIDNALAYSKFYLFEQTFEIVNVPKWGEYEDVGSLNSIFNERLSGIRLSFTLPIRKCCN